MLLPQKVLPRSIVNGRIESHSESTQKRARRDRHIKRNQCNALQIVRADCPPPSLIIGPLIAGDCSHVAEYGLRLQRKRTVDMSCLTRRWRMQPAVSSFSEARVLRLTCNVPSRSAACVSSTVKSTHLVIRTDVAPDHQQQLAPQPYLARHESLDRLHGGGRLHDALRAAHALYSTAFCFARASGPNGGPRRLRFQRRRARGRHVAAGRHVRSHLESVRRGF